MQPGESNKIDCCLDTTVTTGMYACQSLSNENVLFLFLQAHWFCIRKVDDRWYNFNSLYPAPQHLSNFYLSAYLDTLKTSGWSIFVVQGSLPSPNHWATDGGYGRWLTPEEADNITRCCNNAKLVQQSQHSLFDSRVSQRSQASFFILKCRCVSYF